MTVDPKKKEVLKDIIRDLHRGGDPAELKKRFAEVFASKTRAEWEAFNAEHDCCIEPVLRPEELRDDPHVRARGLFADGETSEGPVGEYRTPVTPRDQPFRPAPAAGAHTREVLREAGLSDGEVEELLKAGVLGS